MDLINKESPSRKHPQRNSDLEPLSSWLSLLPKIPLPNPRNGKNTILWQDNIMGNVPLNTSVDLKGIREWLSQRRFIKLTNISVWDASRNCKCGTSQAFQNTCK
jgi:hypothetical protein